MTPSSTETSRVAFEPAQDSRLYEQIAAQIRQHIIEGRLAPREKLPPELSLAEEFGVSRTVVREAIQSLRTRGLVTVVQGRGTFASEPGIDTVSQALSTVFQFRGASLYDLHEVRDIIEVHVAALAAERASEEDKSELLGCLESMEQVRGSPRQYVELDLLFHGILTKATRNEVFLLILEPLLDLLRQSRVEGIQIPGGVKRSLRGHKAIYNAVRTGDSEGARIAMREHLRDVRERLGAAEETQLA
jgi:GntR family transcriptional repressor for pyruvate dehydrogenase complex